MTALDYSVRMLRIAAAAADKQKASDIIAIDVSDALGITDAFLLASATSARHMNAIAEEIEKQLALQGNAKPREREGVGDESWILLDYGDFVIHVMTEESREFYALEGLWKDCPIIDLGMNG